MLFEKRYVKKISRVFENLTAPIRLVDSVGNCLVPEDGAPVRLPSAPLIAGVNHHADELVLRPMDIEPPMYLVAGDNLPGLDDLLIMTDAMLMSMFKSSLSISSASDVYRRALKQELSGADLATRAGEHQIPMDMERAVMLFRIESTEKLSAYMTLGELMPLSDSDALVEINRHQVALIKDMQNVDGSEELYQFARAVQETLMEEAVQTALVGIGESKHSLNQLGESYLEAKRATEVGRIFAPEESIFVFRRLMLERFLMDIPREESLHYHSLLFNRKTAKLFNDEILQTIEMFFRKDLNLSDTARQLYIHRNTLVYRLDKVQRQTGLDLRHFDDAVTFKILYELKKCGQEKPKQIY